MATEKLDYNGKVIEYYMEDRLHHSLKEKIVPSLHEKDKDCFLVIDGREGSGKSTLAFQVGKCVDPTLNLNRVVFSPDDFRDAVYRAKKGQCIIYDEAFTGFSSRSSLGQINRVLVSLSMQMRQKNLLVIIVLPTIFLLDKYIATFRAKALIHVYENKGKRGYFKVYSFKSKKLLILLGQKTFSYSSKFARTNFRGRFYGKFALGDEEMEKKYRDKKEKALKDTEKTSMTAGQIKFREQRDLIIYLLRKTTKLTYKQLQEMLIDYDLDISFQQIQKICGKYGDTGAELEQNKPKRFKDVIKKEESTEKMEKMDEIEEIDDNNDENDDFDLENEENESKSEEID